MLQVTIPGYEWFDEKTNSFGCTKETTLQLEHSLVSIHRWEQKWCKPFLSKDSSADSALKSGTAEVCFVDTGQSDCILIRTEEAAVLIDAGEVGCEGAVCSALEKRGVSVLSLVAATHPHSDHIGSMEAVFDKFSVERLLVPDIPEETLWGGLALNEKKWICKI